MVDIRSIHQANPNNFNLNNLGQTLKLSPTALSQLHKAGQYIAENNPHNNILLMQGVEIVDILHNLNLDEDSLIAGLLVPFILQTQPNFEIITENFGNNVKEILAGVIMMSSISHLDANFNSESQVDKVRRMILAMVNNFQCVIIKLAERITFLRLENTEKQKLIDAAIECQKIYAPLANRLGISQIKWELEDYCFRILQPEEYRQIAKFKLQNKRKDREIFINNFLTNLQNKLASLIENFKLFGRPKHIFSIYKKMQKKNLQFEQLFDLQATRIIVQNIEDCYKALSVLHTEFEHIQEEFDDYIAQPKPNGYQSIHTVIWVDNQPVEVQIRTEQMHEDAELGNAAHWRYKEGINNTTSFDTKINWLRTILNWQQDLLEENSQFAQAKNQLFNDRVYVFTPKGAVIDLESGATPLDFAYHIHTDVGHRCIGAKVAGKIVPFSYTLQMGDQIEIITQKQPNPSRDWLNQNLGFIKTHKARAKILSFFRKENREKDIPQGKEIFEEVLAKFDQDLKNSKHFLNHYKVKTFDDLFANIGAGNIKAVNLINYLQSKLHKEQNTENETLIQSLNKQHHHKTDHSDIKIEGVNNFLHYLSKCCQPIYGDAISGYITHSRGISIHKTDCRQLKKLYKDHPERIIKVQWGKNVGGAGITIKVVALENSHSIKDITAILANLNVKILNAKSKIDRKNNLNIFTLATDVKDLQTLNKALTHISNLEYVLDAKRA